MSIVGDGWFSADPFCLRNDLYCVEWDVKIPYLNYKV